MPAPMPKADANLQFLLRDLPDPNGARLFIERLEKEQPRAHQNLLRPRSNRIPNIFPGSCASAPIRVSERAMS